MDEFRVLVKESLEQVFREVELECDVIILRKGVLFDGKKIF